MTQTQCPTVPLPGAARAGVHTILVVDDSAICRDPLASALEAKGYKTLCAANGREALAIMRSTPFDLVLLDVVMPEMDGFALLAEMRRLADWKHKPVILLTDHAQREFVVRAATSGVQGYILKSKFSLEELYRRVQSCLETAPVPATPPCRGPAAPTVKANPVRPPVARSVAPTAPVVMSSPAKPLAAAVQTDVNDLAPIITKHDLVKLVNEGLELRPLGPTVQNVMMATSSASASVDSVCKAVSTDQALCIRLLKLANSSTYSRGHAVESVRDGVQRIGIQGVRNMVATLDVMGKYDAPASGGLDLRLFWEHSLACGVLAAALAHAVGEKDSDEFFLRGLVHDVGRLILLEHVPQQYAQVREKAVACHIPLEAAEAKMLLVDHCEILNLALQHWKFPADFIQPVVAHHHSLAAIKRTGPKQAKAAAIVALADRTAHGLLIGQSGNDVVYPLFDFATFLGLAPAVFHDITKKAREQVNDLKCSMLARTDGSVWPDFRDALRKRVTAACRPLCLSAAHEFDSVAILLSELLGPCGDETANLLVLHSRDAKDMPALLKRMQMDEEKQGAKNLPVLIVSDQPNVAPDASQVEQRRSAILRAPVPVEVLLDAIESLLRD